MKTNFKILWSRTFVIVFLHILSLRVFAFSPAEAIIATCDIGSFEYDGITAEACLYAVDMKKTGYPHGGMEILINLTTPNDLPASALPTLKDGLKMESRLILKECKKGKPVSLLMVLAQKARTDHYSTMYFVTERTIESYIEQAFTYKIYEPFDQVYYYTNAGKKITFTFIPNKDSMKFYKKYKVFKDEIREYYGMPND